jgi:hypothetical protein
LIFERANTTPVRENQSKKKRELMDKPAEPIYTVIHRCCPHHRSCCRWHLRAPSSHHQAPPTLGRSLPVTRAWPFSVGSGVGGGVEGTGSRAGGGVGHNHQVSRPYPARAIEGVSVMPRARQHRLDWRNGR